MKKIGIIIISMLLILGLAGCKEETKNEDVVGGFSIEGSVAGTLPESAQEAFDKVMEGFTGVGYEPLACIGQQVVAGMNYAILVKSQVVSPDSKAELKVMYIYSPISAEPEIKEIVDFKLIDYLNGEITIENNTTELLGGWNVPEDGGLNAMPQQLATATSALFSTYTDLLIEPLACVGTQVVAGTNYALVCRGKVDENSRSSLYMVEIYDGIDGTQKILSVCPIDLIGLNSK